MSVKELLSNAEIVIGKEELTEKLSKGKTLKVKFGVDPTRPDLTFGHLVVFNKLKQFQDAGHEAILLIGQSNKKNLMAKMTQDRRTRYYHAD